METRTEAADEFGIVARLLAERPNFHLGGAAHWASLPDTLFEIQAAVQPGDVTVETGVGASTVVFAASGAHHTAISPDPREHELVVDYCRQIGVDHSRLAFIADFSEDALPSLLGRERTLDVAFIDGAHCFPFPEVDWCYISRSLKLGGRLVMDDITIPSVEPTFRHMMLEDNWRFERVLDDRGASFTLLRAPNPEDDWPAQRMNARYPDFSYAPLGRRVRLTARSRVQALRRDLAVRYPEPTRVYKQCKEALADRLAR